MSISVYQQVPYNLAKDNANPILGQVTREILEQRFIELQKLIGKNPGVKTFTVYTKINERKLKNVLQDLYSFSKFEDFVLFMTGSKNRVIHTFEEVEADLYDVLNSGECLESRYIKDGKFNIKSVYRVYGVKNWRELTDLLGIDGDHVTVDDESIFEDLISLYERLGRVPSWQDYKNYGKYGTSTLHRKFGGIVNALLKAGFPPSELAYTSFYSKFLSIISSLGEVEREVSFDDLRSPFTNQKLRFDFRVSGVLIEVDGWSHFDKERYMKFFNKTEEDWNKARYRDFLKDSYTFNKKLPFLRIKNENISDEDFVLKSIDNAKNFITDSSSYNFIQYGTLYQ